MSDEPTIVDCKVTILDDLRANYEDSLGQRLPGGPQDIATDQLTRETVEWLNPWVAEHKDCSGRELRLLGGHLYRLIFTGAIGQQFENAHKYFQEQRSKGIETRLRLRLIFSKESTKLVQYPWEFLFLEGSERGHFLAGQTTELILTRFVPAPALQLVDRSRPLRILLAACRPADLPTVDPDDIAEILDNFRQSQVQDEIKVFEIDNPTWPELAREIDKVRPHILHLIAHGGDHTIAMQRPAEDIEAERLDNVTRQATGEPEVRIAQHVFIDADTIARGVQDHPPQLAFLQACDSAAETLTGIYSTARELVYSNIPAVVAMQYEIKSKDANTFANTFYKELAKGRQIDIAVMKARRALAERVDGVGRTWNNRTFGTPVVYLRSENSIIDWEEGQEAPGAAREEEAADPTDASVRCPYYVTTGCKGYVLHEFAVCLTCRKKLKQCPNGHVFGAEIGICGYCGYSADAAAGTSDVYAAPAASPFGGSGLDRPTAARHP